MHYQPPEFRLALILGGARSGKSRLALRLAEQAPPPRLFLATAEAGDAEMAARIEQHRRERGEAWDTREAPLALAAAISAAQGHYGVILVDCLTFWLSNVLLGEPAHAALEETCQGVVDAAARTVTPLILVSNEVGLGIVPDNPLARRFRDAVGGLHQRLAAAADLVCATMAGLPLVLKSPQRKETWYGI
jgi:adenosylcobinamide kinase / adenosylcobinamide-phosphate guanylyltransferase